MVAFGFRRDRTSIAHLTRFAVLVGGLVFLCPQHAFNQQVSGTITGYVTDQSGSAVPGATVTATNALTGVATQRSTARTSRSENRLRSAATRTTETSS